MGKSEFQVSNIPSHDTTTWVPGGLTGHSGNQKPMSQSEEQDTTSGESKNAPSNKVPMFSVSKVASGKQPDLWEPSFRPTVSTEHSQQVLNEKSPEVVSESLNSESEKTTSGQNDAKSPIKWVPPRHVTETETDSMSDSSVGGRPAEIKPLALGKLIKEGSGSDEPSTPDSPSSWKKKRMYAM